MSALTGNVFTWVCTKFLRLHRFHQAPEKSAVSQEKISISVVSSPRVVVKPLGKAISFSPPGIAGGVLFYKVKPLA